MAQRPVREYLLEKIGKVHSKGMSRIESEQRAADALNQDPE